MLEKKVYELEVGGKTIAAEFNNIAEQANASVFMKSGNTVVLVTAVMSDRETDSSWFPLRVDYEERFYAAGQILGSRYMRREGRPSEEAVLSGRIVDRTIRPLFDQRIRHEIQVVVTVLSIGEEDPDVLSVIGASLALGTSPIPWNGPVSAVRVSKHKKGERDINSTYEYRAHEDLHYDVLACGKDSKITMIEVGASEAGEGEMVEALTEAQKHIEEVQAWQKHIIEEIGQEKRSLELAEVSPEVKALFSEHLADTLDEKIFSNEPGKKAIGALEEEWARLLDEHLPDESKGLAFAYLNEEIDEAVHRGALERDARVDGRGMDEVRPLFAQAGGISPTHHGAGLFYRGGTHVLSVLTLGGPDDALVIDGMEAQKEKRFFHHYNFPPFSVGEAGRIGGFNRREIGHGALAEKALRAGRPSKEDFPYTIRVVSEALSSNGSTSMGSVCGGTLAMMDAGVPIKRPVAGIAMGVMIAEGDKSETRNTKHEINSKIQNTKYKILTDIQGPEDHHGDMDFKVAGTRGGITAVQMDVKVEGVGLDILAEALERAKAARLKILDVIEAEIAEPRTELSPHAPRIEAIRIKPEQIGEVIGSGGKTVNEIRDATGTEISIEDDGMVYITGGYPGVDQAKEMILSMTREYQEGERFEGIVVKVTDFGAFVKIGYNKEGLVHVSEIANFRVERVSDYLSEGDKVPVVLQKIDERGRLNLSIKAADPQFITATTGENEQKGGGIKE